MAKFKITAILILVAYSSIAGSACRSAAIKRKFDVLSGYPHGRPGYIVDHVCSLFNGGIDDPKNMQYQTVRESKKKDRVENTPLGKKLYCTSANSTPKRMVFNCK
jgi:hypothetical protein